MKTNTLNIIVATAVILSIMFLAISSSRTQTVNGSAIQGMDYNATSTFAMLGGIDGTNPTAASSHLYRTLGSGNNSLGSVIVASSSATTFRVWNATSTTDIASTSLVHFVASPANGTYTFDVVAPRGLIVDMPTGFNGAYTVTFR